MGTEVHWQLKSRLFDFLISKQIMNQEEKMHHVLNEITQVMQAEHAWCILDDEHMSNQKIYFSETFQYVLVGMNYKEDVYRKHMSIRQVIDPSSFHILENNEYVITFPYDETNVGYLYMQFDRTLDESYLTFVSEMMTDIMDFIFNSEEKEALLVKERLFHLAYALQSLHDTADILEMILQTLKQISPIKAITFLMAHEVPGTSLPIQLFSYNELDDQKESREAFIKNKLTTETIDDTIYLYAPLSGSQAVYGLVQMKRKANNVYSTAEKEMIKNICELAGRAIERTTLYETSNQLVSDLQHINKASQHLNENLNSIEVIQIVIQHIKTACAPNEIGIIFYEDEYADEYRVAENSTSFFQTDKGQQLARHMHEKFSKQNRPFISGDFEEEFSESPYSSVIAIPMVHADYFVGILILAHPSPYYFTFNNFKFLQAFSQHATLSLMNAYLKDELKLATITDYLTKISTRGHIDDVMEKDLKAIDHGAFMLFDVDDFKYVNDKYGHYIGDEILVQLANVLKNIVQEDGIAARWGGEEFAVYLRGKSMKYAVQKAEQIRKEVMEKTNPSVTVSCGVFAWEALSTYTKPTNIFIQADKALYEAKETGKNKIVSYI